MNWLCVLVGRSCSGKTTLVRILANLLGVNLVEFSVNNATDTSDLLGGFEKVKHHKSQLVNLYEHLKSIYLSSIIKCDQTMVPFSLRLIQAYLKLVFESRRLFNKSDLDENPDSSRSIMDLFKTNLEILESLNIEGEKREN